MTRLAGLAVAMLCTTVGTRAQQRFDGYVSLLGDVFPSLETTEFRPRVVADYRRDVGSRIHISAAGFVDGLIRNRSDAGVSGDAIVRAHDLSIEARWTHADLRVGFTRVVWGRLDEFLPTDVVNPQDLTRFFLEGRAEGRMPVGMVRARWLPSDVFSIEGIYVPVFRRGRFDQLEESTAPFNVGPPAVLTIQLEPAHTLRHAQGGVRASATTGRVDWSVSAYRGFEPLPLYERFHAVFPRFTMIGGDFETVRGLWGIRGEIAAFVERSLQSGSAAHIVNGRAVEAGAGVDRKAGSFRLSGNAIFTTSTLRTDLLVVGSLDRSFARETRALRVFGVYNPKEDSAFARVIGTVSVREHVSLEGSGGVFTGTATGTLGRFADRDFVYARLKVFF